MGELFSKVHRQRSSVKPWSSADSVRADDYKYSPIHCPDEQAEIDLCINCPLPAKRCAGNGGCYEAAKLERLKLAGIRKQRGAFNADKFRAAMESGYTDEQVSAAFGVTKKTAWKWRKKYGVKEGGGDCEKKV